MKKVVILTDSTSDLTKEDRQTYQIDYVKMNFTQNDVEHPADLDWVEVSPKDYYQGMRNGNRAITNLVPTEQFEEKFRQYHDLDCDVLYISCSSKLSGSYNNGMAVAEDFTNSFPEMKIKCVDSLRSNMSQGLLAIEAAKLANEGKSLDEIVNYLEENKLCAQTYATVATLDWLKKAGRVKGSKAFFGNLFGVKPIIVGDIKGSNYAFKKEKGRAASLEALANMVVEQKNENTNVVYVEHADAKFTAEELVKTITQKTGITDVRICDLGPIIGATTGPDTITVSFIGKKVTICGEE